MMFFFSLKLYGVFEGEDGEEKSGENNLGLTTIDADQSLKDTVQEGDSNGYSDNDSTEYSNPIENSGSLLITPPTQETSSPRALRAIADFAKKIYFAQQDFDDLKVQRREIQAEVDRGFAISFEDKKNIGIEVRSTCEKWNRERAFYHADEGEIKDETDYQTGEQIHKLFALMDSISQEAEETLLLLFPEKRVRNVVMAKTNRESLDASLSSFHRSIGSSAVIQNKESDSSTLKEVGQELSYSYRFPYFEFFQTKAEVALLKIALEKKEHSYEEAMSRLVAEKKKRDSAVKDFRKKHRFQLCKSATPIIEDYQPRIERAQLSVAQQEKELQEIRKTMGIHHDNVSYFASEIRSEVYQEVKSWKNSSEGSNSQLTYFNEWLRNMRDYFLKKDYRLSAADLEKIGWDELLPEK